MKKKIIKFCLILLICITPVVCNEVYINIVRFSTPTEAFLKSKQKDCELVDILEDKNIALLIYKNNETYSDSIIEKDSRGWTSLSIDYNNKKEIMYDKGFIYIKEIQGKFVIQTVTIIEKNGSVPTILDIENSDFLLELCKLNDGRKLLYGFLVLEYNINENYLIKIGEEKIKITIE